MRLFETTWAPLSPKSPVNRQGPNGGPGAQAGPRGPMAPEDPNGTSLDHWEPKDPVQQNICGDLEPRRPRCTHYGFDEITKLMLYVLGPEGPPEATKLAKGLQAKFQQGLFESN